MSVESFPLMTHINLPRKIRDRIPKDCPSVTTLPESGRLARHKASRDAHLLYLRSMSHSQRFLKAGDRDRTGNIQLGRLTLYQLSYTRG